MCQNVFEDGEDQHVREGHHIPTPSVENQHVGATKLIQPPLESNLTPTNAAFQIRLSMVAWAIQGHT